MFNQFPLLRIGGDDLGYLACLSAKAARFVRFVPRIRLRVKVCLISGCILP